MNTSRAHAICRTCIICLGLLININQAFGEIGATLEKRELSGKQEAGIARFEVYPWEIKQDKRFLKSWKDATNSSSIPRWVKQLEMVATKGQRIMTEDGWAVVYSGNRIHGGEVSEVTFAYLPSRRLVCGALKEASRVTRFGNRGACERSFATAIQSGKEN